MFGKSSEGKKIKALEDEILLLKVQMQSKFQKLDWANDLIQLRGLKEKFTELEKSLNKKILELEKQIEDLKKIKTISGSDLPEVPWIREVIVNPKSEKFQCLKDIQKITIWKNIFDSIGLTGKTDIVHQFPFHMDKEIFLDKDMQYYGLAYLGHLGNDSDVFVNFRDFKMLSEEFQAYVERIIRMAIPNAEIDDYKIEYLKESQQFQISYNLNSKKVDFLIEGLKYMDMYLVTKVVQSMAGDLDPSKSFLWLTCDFGSYLFYVNYYQKNVIEQLIKLKRGLEPIED